MTRRLLALLLLVVAMPAAAQPTDALIDRVIARQHLGAYSTVAFGRYVTNFKSLDTTIVIDSVRAAFRRDARPELLREALVYLDSPAAVAFERRTRLRTLSEDALGVGLFDADPKKGSVADSLLAARYGRAVATDSFIVDMMDQILALVTARMPQAASPDAKQGIELGRAMVIGMVLPQVERSQRIALAGAAQPDVEAFIAHAESPAGRYVRQTTMGALRGAASAQMLIESEAGSFEVDHDESEPPVDRESPFSKPLRDG